MASKTEAERRDAVRRTRERYEALSEEICKLQCMCTDSTDRSEQQSNRTRPDSGESLYAIDSRRETLSRRNGVRATRAERDSESSGLR
jgi:hypothetical protein